MRNPTIITIFSLFLLIIVGTGCGKHVVKPDAQDNFPYEMEGKVWDGKDGNLYTVAKGIDVHYTDAYDAAKGGARAQFHQYVSDQDEIMLYKSSEKKFRETKEGLYYVFYVLFTLPKESNPHLFKN